jgi:dTDP-4-dehydrorhamnose 3,5-epimerase
MSPAGKSSAAPIDGVVVTVLKKVMNERGHLMEVQRADDAHFPGFGQTYVTRTRAGVVKAWYRHHAQIDQIALIRGDLLLVLFDSRETSPTCGVVQPIHMTNERPLLVQIPIGIWHGFQAQGAEDAWLLHLNTQPFRFEGPDEDRLPADDRAIPYRWAE